MRCRFFLLILLGGMMGPLTAQNLFWDDPQFQARGSENARFPQTAWNPDLSVVLWQERPPEGDWPRYTFTLGYRPTGGEWTYRKNVLPAVTMPGQDVNLFALSLGGDGSLYAAVLQADGSIHIFRASGPEQEFTQTAVVGAADALGSPLEPRLYLNPDGSLTLLTTMAYEDSFQILLSRGSAGGRSWTGLTPVNDRPELDLNFSPSLVWKSGKGYLAFQSRIFYQIRSATGQLNTRSAYQIYLRITEDGGRTWLPSQLVTDQGASGLPAPQLNNERPSLSTDGKDLQMVWERSFSGGRKQVIFGILDDQGKLTDSQEVSGSSGVAISPQLIQFQGSTYLTWLDNRNQKFNFYWAQRSGRVWRAQTQASLLEDTVFVQGIPAADGLFFFREDRLRDRSSVVLLQPDRRSEPPSIAPEDFTPGRRYKNESFTISLTAARDPNGVEGFNYLWTRNSEEPVPRESRFGAFQRRHTDRLEEEGLWYLKAIQRDGAGNWSPEALVTLTVDRTPPDPVRMINPPRDAQGLLPSNSFEIQWEPRSEDTLGYNYTLAQVASPGLPVNWDRVEIPRPGPFIITNQPRASFTNRENGLWGLAVVALDEAGNASEPAATFFRLGRFIASTRIDQVSYQQDEFGRLAVRVDGRGFATEGNIARVVLDQDGKAPWDFETTDFRILSDRSLRLGLVEYLSQGLYRLGVIHPSRGLVLSRPVMRVDEKGTVKFGDYSAWGEFPWQFTDPGKWALRVDNVYFWLVLTFLGLWFLLSGTQTVAVVREARTLNQSLKTITSALGGSPMALEQRKQAEKAVRRGRLGLRLKFTLSILSLTVAVILMLSLTMGFFIIDNSQRSLAQGLRQRTAVLSSSLAQVAVSNLSRLTTATQFAMNSLPRQIRSMGEDAVYATFTGPWNTANTPGQEPQSGFNYVWGSNDPGISEKIGGVALTPPLGTKALMDAASERLAQLEGEVNSLAREQVGTNQTRIAELEAAAKPFESRTDAAGQRIYQDYLTQLDDLEREITPKLDEITSTRFESIPPFDPENLDPDQKSYIFIRPIIYSGGEGFYKGAVRIEVSVESILSQIAASRDQLIGLTVLIAAVALGLGLIGSLILSAITVNPIKLLVKGVNRIRETEDKSELKDFQLVVKSKDELADLADSINTMAYGLYKAAEAAKDLTVGKDTQKMFINLDKDTTGRKTTTASFATKEIELFGYYEGAKGVSGDYFDYGDLNEEYLYFIKCDVSGKGVPAALIMVEVATIVLNHFRFWDPKKDGIRLAPTVSRINTLLEERGFKGRFAALTLGLVNKKTRKVVLCHAGDKMVQIYNNATGRMETKVLVEVPATGVFSQDLMDLRGMAYKEEMIQLHPGDVLFMYTDGIEETQRKFRDANFDVMAFWDPKDPSTKVPAGSKRTVNGKDEQSIDNEDLGPDQVHRIIEALIHRGKYHMEKAYNPLPGENLEFDFSPTDGSMRDIIMGLAAVEKVWRLYPDPRATAEDLLRVDVEIDRILKNCFLSHGRYFRTPPLPRKKEDPMEYLYYPRMVEDDQYDDLTLLGIRFK